ncbi:MAG: LCP family protein [Eubacterium sp.]|jgi:anionic cell wall polymer biosynthesis LytR-Cps2A-Psr (LCP) family protein|nr:LCP family protein [Eubacterium sp.]
MAEKKTVKRRSNWYIYLITFILTSIVLLLVVLSMRDVLFPEPQSSNLSAIGIADYRPEVSFNTNVIFMMSEAKGGVPDYYLLANYRPRDDALVLVPIDKRLYSKAGGVSGDLSEIYSKSGATGIITAIQNTIGVNCDYYFKFDKTALTDFIDLVGEVTANVPYDLKSGDQTIFESGTQSFNGQEVYDYITFSEDGQDENRSAVVLATIAAGFMNENSRDKTAAELQSYARKLVNTTDTNYKMEDFTENQSAYLYTTQYSYNIAENYVPLYNYDDSNRYIIADTSVATIKDRFNI